MKKYEIVPKYICPNGTYVIYMMKYKNGPYGKPYIIGNANGKMIHKRVLERLVVDEPIEVIVPEGTFVWNDFETYMD